MSAVAEFGASAGLTWFPYQAEAAEAWMADPAPAPRHCLYFRTGAGKTVTALLLMALRGVHEVLVLTPPATQDAWVKDGLRFGVTVTPISHATFRMRDYKVSRNQAIIVDEFHLLGGHGGKGWQKLDRLARGLQAPLLILSATPNYNDADRCYCIEHVCAPQTVQGGILAYIYSRCITEPNPYSQTPYVKGFQGYADASAYLDSLPYVHYVADNVQYQIVDVDVVAPVPAELEELGIDRRRGRLIASQMEGHHAVMRHQYLTDTGEVHANVMAWLETLTGNATTPVLIFCNSATIAQAIYDDCSQGNDRIALVTGKATTKHKLWAVSQMRRGELDVLIGTATLATGVDGLDKVCDTLIIANDTTDPALRRQLIGRIMPRGESVDASMKQVYRLQLST